ncbi:MAG: hypothetical protein PHQ74_14730 [Crocinitomicaceae bacterium]|nr:hypothetical protein [Crocinitomicaceae bacterium]
MKNLLFIFVVIILQTGCTKNKPKVGDYEAWFYGTYSKNGQTVAYDRFQEVSIVSVNESEISLSIYNDGTVSSILNKDKKIVSGIFKMLGQGGTGGPSYPSNDIFITGTWEKNKGKYSITGYHQWVYTEVDVQTQEINEHIVSGNFEIKSK